MNDLFAAFVVTGASMFAVSKISGWTTRGYLRALYQKNPLAMHDYMMGHSNKIPKLPR